ncbi:hypothetical protein BHM03_00025615 [Ensete ventricosum]|nr:hypothetical protein BHM03_00025615 [Ensete ventricosum]
MAQPLCQPPPQPVSLDLRDLKALSVLGRGAKGVVFLVRAVASSGEEALALKAVSRSSIERKASSGDAYRRVWLERDVLLALRHPLLPSLRGVVSTDRIVGFAIDRCSGGDLASLRRRQSENMFSDDVIRFYAAELVLALEYLHGLGIVYRDLKPENVMIQDSGHLMLVDFDLSAKLSSKPLPEQPLRSSPPTAVRRVESMPPGTGMKKKKKKNTKIKGKMYPRLMGCFSFNSGVSPETIEAPPAAKPPSSSTWSSRGKSNSFVGTEEYVAPEIIEGRGHDFAVDWWGLGVVLYEMLYGRTPFRGQNRKETFYRILTKEPELSGEPTPLRDLIRRLLEKNPERRITGERIKAHEFFRGVVWDEVIQVSRPPFIPMPPLDHVESGDAGSEGLDVERTVDEVSAAKEEAEAKTKTASGNRAEAVTVSPNSTDFSVF